MYSGQQDLYFVLQGDKGARGPPGIDGPPGRQGFPGTQVRCSYNQDPLTCVTIMTVLYRVHLGQLVTQEIWELLEQEDQKELK